MFGSSVCDHLGSQLKCCLLSLLLDVISPVYLSTLLVIHVLVDHPLKSGYLVSNCILVDDVCIYVRVDQFFHICWCFHTLGVYGVSPICIWLVDHLVKVLVLLSSHSFVVEALLVCFVSLHNRQVRMLDRFGWHLQFSLRQQCYLFDSAEGHLTLLSQYLRRSRHSCLWSELRWSIFHYLHLLLLMSSFRLLSRNGSGHL